MCPKCVLQVLSQPGAQDKGFDRSIFVNPYSKLAAGTAILLRWVFMDLPCA
jgi:hypothetical protein